MRTLNGVNRPKNLYQPAINLFDKEIRPEAGAEAMGRRQMAKNAFVESTSIHNRTGFVTISYGAMGRNRIVEVQVVTLVVGKQTRIWDQFGNRIGFRELNPGMVVDASFSEDMTKSNPPQAQAYTITVVRERKSSIIDEGRVLEVTADGRFGYILTGVANNPNRQMRYVVSNETKLRDRQGNRINLMAIRPGQIVRIEREAFQTASIPPQTSALAVQIISR